MVGSTRNSILQGTFELNFQEIVTGHVDEVCALATHPQQNQFLTAGYDNLLHLWDTLTHRAVWSSNIGVSESFIEVSVHKIPCLKNTHNRQIVSDAQLICSSQLCCFIMH